MTRLPALLACVALAVACGSAPGRDATRAAPAVDLTITVDDGTGGSARAALSCRDGSAAATGFLRRDAEPLCRRARRLAPFLARPPDRSRACAQIYGGPETARVHGTVGALRIDRRFSRRDACEIADWKRAAFLLGRGA